jgi:GNAT superfamily N-acetyltransferase
MKTGTDTAQLPLRFATLADTERIDGLMKRSIRDNFPAFYGEQETESSVRYIAEVDRMLVQDGTYFVIEEEEQFVACGGWSRRDKLYTGSGASAGNARLLDPATEAARVRAMFVRGDRTRRGLGTRILDACRDAARREGFRMLALMATLPGLQLYTRYGFRVTETTTILLPDGVTLAGAAMEMPIE